MSELPKELQIDKPPFSHCGVDMFGSFLVKEGRKIHKRYGAMFTCLHSHAVHMETTNSMTTHSFIQALRRPISRKGNIRIIQSNDSNNFVGASTELKRALNEMGKKKINGFVMEGEWLIWRHNPPTANSMEGVWEQYAKTLNILTSKVRYVLSKILVATSTCM